MRNTIINIIFISLALSIFLNITAQNNIQFIKNKGQWDNSISYKTPLQFGDIYFEKDNWAFLLQTALHNHNNEQTEEVNKNYITGHFYKMVFLNATTDEVLPLENAEEHYYNYFIGRNKSKWASKVPVYTSLLYKNIYPKTDIILKEQDGNLKYNVHIKPGGNPNNIQIQYNGIENPRIENGNLLYHTSIADVTELKPYAYQIIDGKEIEIACEYKFNVKNNTLSFNVKEKYNTSIELVIDPVLIFSRLTESTNSNFGFTATYDSIGRAYGGGIVFNGAGQYPTSVGAYDTSFNSGIIDIAISCYHQTTGAQIYGTFVGGNETELPNSMIVNNAGELVVLGATSSSNFPITPNAYDTTFIGGDTADYPSNGVHLYSGSDMVLFKLSNDGSNLNASTLFGGSDNDGLNDDTTYQGIYNLTDLNFNYGDAFRGEVIVDSSNNIYVASSTNSRDFPIVNTTDTLQGLQDGIVVKFTPQLDSIIFSRYLGGSGNDGAYSMKIDNYGNLFVVGGTMSSDFPATNTYNGGVADGFIAKLDGNNGSIQNAIYIGTDSFDQVYLIDIDLNNDVYIMGQTLGTYPMFNALYGNPQGKQFLHKFSNNLSSTFYSTCFGSDSLKIEISPTALLVDICERVFVSGWGGATNYFHNSQYTTYLLQNLPITSDAVQSIYNNFGDFYFFILDKNATALEYATFFGGTAREHVDGGTSRFDENGIIYQAVCAACSGGTFVTTPGYSNFATTQCNLGTIKFDMELPSTRVEVDAYPRATGCTPLTVNFFADTLSVSSVTWFFGDGNTSNLLYPVHTYSDTGIYDVMLIGIDSNSCNLADTASLSVEVRDDSLSANFINDYVINCYNQSFSASVPNYPTTQYYWNMGDGNFYYTDSVFHIYANSGNYTVRLFLTDSTSCELEDSAQTTINIPPIFNVNIQLTDTFGCIPLNVNFESSYTNFDSIIWNFGNGQTVYNNLDTNITYTQANNYQVQLIIIDSSTCNITDSAYTNILTINDSTRANIALDSTYFDCDSMQLNVNSLNFGADSFTWIFDNGITSNNANDSTLYTAGDYNGMYIVTDNSNICYPTDTRYFDMHLLPKFETDIIASDTFGCIPLNVNFESTYTTFNSLEWNFGNGQTVYNNLDTNITYTQANNYQVQLIIIDSSTCNITDTAYTNILTINDSTRANIALDSTYFDCDSMQLNVNSLNFGADSFTWIFDNGITSNNANDSTLYTAGDYNGMYIVTDNSNICYPTDTAYFEMHLLPKLIANFAVDNYGCLPFTSNFNAESNSDSATYLWNFGTGASSNQEDTIFTYTNIGNYPISLLITDSATCNIDTLLETSILVEEGQVYIDIQIDKNNFGCDSIQVHLQTFYVGGIHEWDMGNGDILYGTDLYYSYTQYGSYTIQYTINDALQDCKPTDSAYYQIEFYRVEAILEASDTAGCIPLEIDFDNLTQGNNTYWWDNNLNNLSTSPTIPNFTYTSVGNFTFTLVATDTNSCNINDTATINITTNDDAVFADFEAEILNECDSNLLIAIDNTSQMATDYFWNYEIGTSTQEEIDSVQYNLPGTYTITLLARNENLCHPADTVAKTFTMLPNVTASFKAIATCEGKPIEIINNSQTNLEYSWNFGSNQFSTEFEPEITYQNSGNHTIQLIVTDTNSCNLTAIAYQTVYVANFPNVYFTTDSNYYIYPDEVNFNNQTTQYEGFKWRFGDGDEDSLTYSPTHQYETIDEFTPCLIAWNSNCIDTFCKEIEIDFIPLIGVPNAFSPNNDGFNDIVYVEGTGIVELHFIIYNRWGEIVFESYDQNIGWDGTYKGTAQEMEVYTYVVNAKLLDGSSPILKGNITLLR